jgi:hypothetical protein
LFQKRIYSIFLGTLVGKQKQTIFEKRWFDITSALINRGAPFPIYQANLGGPFSQGCARSNLSGNFWRTLLPGVRPSPRGVLFSQGHALSNLSGKLGRALLTGAHPSHRGSIKQVCQELRVDGGIAKPGWVKDTCTTVALVSFMSARNPGTVGVTLP